MACKWLKLNNLLPPVVKKRGSPAEWILPYLSERFKEHLRIEEKGYGIVSFMSG